ncbi:hypothetical protein ABQF26_03715 [Mycolicibacterium elephantis]
MTASTEDQAAADVAATLTRDEVRAALHCIDAYRRGHAAAGRPVPAAVLALLRRLETAHRTKGVEESTRRPFGGGAEQLTSWIGTGQAAELLGISCRAVWRRRHDLDGQQINGRWWYPAATIRDMKRRKEIDA